MKRQLGWRKVQAVSQFHQSWRAQRLCATSPAARPARARLDAVQGPVYLSPYFVRSPLFSCRKVILGVGGWGEQEMPYGNRKPKWFMCWGMQGRGWGMEGRGSAPSVFKGTLWIDLLSKKITKRVGKLLRKLSSETFPSYSLLICLPCFIGLLLLS